jgi:hypothetical protein
MPVLARLAALLTLSLVLAAGTLDGRSGSRSASGPTRSGDVSGPP